MNSLTRRDRFDDLLPEFFRRFARIAPFGDEAPADIRIDVTENDKDYEVLAQMPGVKKEDIRIAVDGNFVSISAEVKKDQEGPSNGGRVLLKETYHGSTSRGFSLGHEIDDKAVVAKLENGVLRLTLPKREGAGARTIAVQ
ncbi:Hsp20 family protein [Aquincola sp. MAHUQ-54]|uniref:Hsp20 family protein n=1 Tax=Aquincola agrisoli TaxID=3119538 RepID=A0AAW9Q7F1_9BURK